MLMRTRAAVVAGSLFLATAWSLGAVQKLDDRMHHLRWGATREWDTFPEQAESEALSITFESTANDGERTLRLRHRDLKQAWQITLNGKKLAALPRDEPDMVTYWAVPPGMVKQGRNELQIGCKAPAPPAGRAPGAAIDDVMIGEVQLIDLPRSKALADATIEVSVVSGDSTTGLPCRITIADERGILIDVGNTSSTRLAVRPGVVYTADGRAALSLAAGRYTIYAGRGFEYNVDSVTLDVRPGDKQSKTLRLRRVVPTDGLVACDTHLHTFTFSRHGDATIEERMITLAGEGIELPIATDHNLQISYEAPAQQTQTRSHFTPVTGNEVTTKQGHFNVFPLASVGKLPDWRSPTWTSLAKSIDEAKVGDHAIVILNHARDLHYSFRPFDPSRHISMTGEDLAGWELPANAMEVINSGATQTDPMQLYRDWFGLLNRGRQITPIGASDSHDVSRYIVGQARTYVRVADKDPGNIGIREAVRSVRNRRVMVSYGLLTTLSVNDQFREGDLAPAADAADKPIKVDVTVFGPEWTQATKVTLYANGVPVASENVARPAGTVEPAGLKWQKTWMLQRPNHDVWFTAIASGPGVTAPYWAMAKPYQQTSQSWKSYVIGSSGAVQVDADGSGAFDSAFDYADRIVKTAGGDANKVVAALTKLEVVGSDAQQPSPSVAAATAQSIAAQAASLLRKESTTDFDSRLRPLLQNAGPATRQGLEQYLAAWSQSASAASEQAQREKQP